MLSSCQWDTPSLVMVAYDVSSEQSFDSCVKWLERVRAQKPAVETQLPGTLYSHKSDITHCVSCSCRSAGGL